MFHNMKEMKKFDIVATDGPIGTVHDFLLDDKYWTVRYLVVDTRKWLPGEKVLISPMSIKDFDLVNGAIQLSLTKEEIKDSPPIDADKPVSRKYETEFNNYYGLRPYWQGPGFWGTYMYPKELARSVINNEEEKAHEEIPEQETNLRSFVELKGYMIEAVDGEIGHVETFVICDETWNIRYIVVNTNNWWFGKHVLVATQWINYVNWQDRLVNIDLKKDTIKNGPEYDPNMGVTREFEDEIFTRYDKPKYWL